MKSSWAPGVGEDEEKSRLSIHTMTWGYRGLRYALKLVLSWGASCYTLPDSGGLTWGWTVRQSCRLKLTSGVRASARLQEPDRVERRHY
jgi:hypothetical protein